MQETQNPRYEASRSGVKRDECSEDLMRFATKMTPPWRTFKILFKLNENKKKQQDVQIIPHLSNVDKWGMIKFDTK